MRLRRTLLWSKALDLDNLKADIACEADCIVLDLEDGVIAGLKDQARAGTAMVLREWDFRGKERVVRINHLDTPDAQKDLDAVLPAVPDAIRLPKCETPDYVLRLDKLLADYERAHNLKLGGIELILMIETALGIRNAYELAACCARVTAIGVGMEDLTASMGLQRHYDLEATDLLYARQKLVLDAKAAGVQALDSGVLFDGNVEYMVADTRAIKRHGFTGRSVGDRTLVPYINEVFTPDSSEVDWARRVKDAYQQGLDSGRTDIYVDGFFIDPPVVAKADNILRSAAAIGQRRQA